MYIDTVKFKKKNGAIYERILLRRSYREGKKVKKETMANLSGCTEEEIQSIKFALKNKKILPTLNLDDPKRLNNVQSVGAVYVLKKVANQLGITEALGNQRNGRLALWQVFSRIIRGGSRLAAVRLARTHAVCDILNLNTFDEDHLYNNLKWIATKQQNIETFLWKRRNNNKNRVHLAFLYDVTSSYLEGKMQLLWELGL